MTFRRVVTIVLLTFVLGSLGYMIAKETFLAGSKAPSIPQAELAHVEDGHPSVIVYFFDSDKECTTCTNLKEYAYEALQTYFPSQLASGDIAWRALNVDQPENEHYVTEFGLYSKSVVVVRIEDEQQTEWKNLESIWDLVYDKPAYIEYIRAEVQDFAGDPS